MQDHLLDNLSGQNSEATKRLIHQAQQFALLNQKLSKAVGIEVSVCRFDQGTLVLQVNDGSLATRLRYRAPGMLRELSTVMDSGVLRVEIKVGPHPTWLKSKDSATDQERDNARTPTPMSEETGELLRTQAAMMKDSDLGRAFRALSAHAFVKS